MAEHPLLPYHREVDSFGSRTLKTESGQTNKYEEAFLDKDCVKKALQLGTENVPIDFTMFVLRKMAVNEKVKDFRSFMLALPLQAREYLQKLIGPQDRQSSTRVHSPNREGTSSFRGAFIKIFCKKVICNFAKNQEDKHYDKFATVFPFKVSLNLPQREMKILKKYNDDFYKEVQFFLNRHFENVDAREISKLFLLNIYNFELKYFSAKSLLKRLENPRDQHDDYLSTFPRLNDKGIERFLFLYREFVNAMRSNEIYVTECYSNCDEEYFRRLPEKNFADLYSFFDVEFFENNRSIYMRRFRKYLFFFVHALAADSNPVFFIDDVLFECLKSFRRYKTVKEDVSMKHDLVRITILHYRTNLMRSKSYRKYGLNDETLQRIKKYILEFVIPENPQLNVKYKTDLLTWMPFRTDDACFNVCYSNKGGIKDFLERLLCSVLCPDNEPVKCIIGYNAFKGIVHRYDLPKDVESLKNFIRLCNTCDVTGEPLEESNDDFISKTFLPFTETKHVRATEVYE